MKYCGVVTFAILATLAVVSNGAPDGSSDSNFHEYGPPPPPGNESQSGNGMHFSEGGSFQMNAQESGSSRFLVKRDLANKDAPLSPHVHTAACRGNGPPPSNITSA